MNGVRDPRFPNRQLKSLLCPRRVDGWPTRMRLWAGTDALFDFCAHGFAVDAESFQNSPNLAALFAEQSEQHVFGADEIVFGCQLLIAHAMISSDDLRAARSSPAAKANPIAIGKQAKNPIAGIIPSPSRAKSGNINWT
jgi:hypothetical protein